MFLFLEERLSDSPFVERIWRAHSERGGAFLSIAASRFEMAVTRLRGRTFLTIRGPETKATTADCPADGEWLGIRFKLGTFMPQLAPGPSPRSKGCNASGRDESVVLARRLGVGIPRLRERGGIRDPACAEGHHRA